MNDADDLFGRSHATSQAPIISRLDPDGSLSLRALAAKLTAEVSANTGRRRCLDRGGSCAGQGASGGQKRPACAVKK
jgi:hypothetical protein